MAAAVRSTLSSTSTENHAPTDSSAGVTPWRPKNRTSSRVSLSTEMASESEHVLHGVEPGAAARDPPRGTQGAAREGVTAVRAVGDLDALAERAEGDRVLAHDVAGAQRQDADLLARTLARRAL